MTTKTVVGFEEQTGVTGTSAAMLVKPEAEVTVAALLTAGTPATGARVQVTLDDASRILAESATWVNSPLGARTASGAEKLGKPVTGVRLVVTDGTWTFQVRAVEA